MGLKEKRIIKSFEENYLNQFKNDINSIVGKEVNFDINWDQLCTHADPEQIEEIWQIGGFEPTKEALKAIASDEFGKEALNEGIDTIHILGDYAHSLEANYSDNVLKVDFAFYTKHAAGAIGDSEYKDRVGRIQSCLENKLG